MLPAPVVARLTPDDDPRLWALVLQTLATEAAALSPPTTLRLQLGCCSHWARPHQTRWTAAGGFAWPEGYGPGHGLRFAAPQHDWTVTLALRESAWQEATLGRRPLILRVTVPARTARHRQVAVHALWPPTSDPVFYGFRRDAAGWALTAVRDTRVWPD